MLSVECWTFKVFTGPIAFIEFVGFADLWIDGFVSFKYGDGHLAKGGF